MSAIVPAGLAASLAVMLSGTLHAAAPGTPVFSPIFDTQDAVTGNNQFINQDGKHRWFVDSATDPDGLADHYFEDVYERPTAQTFEANQQVQTKIGADVDLTKTYVAAKEYLGYLDLTEGRFGFDNTHMYFEMTLFSAAKVTENGEENLGEFGSGAMYGVRLSGDPNGAGGLLLRAPGDKPELQTSNFSNIGTQGFLDSNRDVGGPGGIGAVNENPGSMNGYESNAILSDGKLSSGEQVLFARINKTSAQPVVQLAFDYATFNVALPNFAVNPSLLPYLVYEANRGTKDPGNYLWNDKYSFAQAGNPYAAPGLGSVYELDTLTMVIPLPAAAWLFLTGLGALGAVRWRKHRSSATDLKLAPA